MFKVFNWSEVHLSKMTCYKIHTLTSSLLKFIQSLWFKDLVGKKACYFLDNFRLNLPLCSVGHGQISSRVELCLLLCLAVLSDDVTLVEKFPAWMQKIVLLPNFVKVKSVQK